MSHEKSIEELFLQYVQGADGTKNKNPKIANKSHDRMHVAFKILRESEEGRQKILSLLNHESPHVRLWAAGHSLKWRPNEAKSVLEALRDSDSPGSVSAEITLKEFEKGSLSFDY